MRIRKGSGIIAQIDKDFVLAGISTLKIDRRRSGSAERLLGMKRETRVGQGGA